MIVHTAVEQWVDARLARREISRSTAAGYTRSLKSFADHIGHRPVSEVTTEDFEHWLATQRVAGSTLNTRAAPVRAFFKWCAVRGHLVADPTLGVARAKTEKAMPKRLPEETITKLLVVSDFRATVVMMLGLHLGLRCCEMSRLQLEHWDRERCTIDVHGKGNKWRTLPVAGEVELVLGMWTSQWRRARGPVFPSQQVRGESITANTVSSIVTRTARTAQVKATAHRLRHTFGYTAISSGIPPNVVQAMMGHESMAVTSRYSMADVDDLRRHMAKWSYLA